MKNIHKLNNTTSDYKFSMHSQSRFRPIEQNFKNMRIVRQNNNNKVVYESLKEGSLKRLNKNINHKEYKRTIEDLELTEVDFLLKCKNDHLFAKLASRTISKKSSRQGNKDEIEQIKTCNITSQKCGITITHLNAKEKRPTKDGFIISNEEMKIKQIKKNSCLKSFDAIISGKINGFISAKVVYGDGGHQDNVFEEMETLAEWWKKYKILSKEFLILLIDTDLIKKITNIKKKYSSIKNIKVFNHIEFQEYIINEYYIYESI